MHERNKGIWNFDEKTKKEITGDSCVDGGE